jgi:rubrerythrin
LESTDSLGNDLFCSSLLEKRTYELYTELVEKVEHPVVKPLLVSVAQDSRKHSSLFEVISRDFVNNPPNEKLCKKQLGIIWRYVDDVFEFVNNKKSLSSVDLLDLIKNLSSVEYYMGEEYTILEKVKTLTYMNKEISKIYGIELDDVLMSHRNVFSSIINDERNHREILYNIGELLAKEIVSKNVHPTFKYQTPDAWAFQPPHKEIR